MPIVRHLRRSWQRLALAAALVFALGVAAVYQTFSQTPVPKPIPDIPPPVVVGPQGAQPGQTPAAEPAPAATPTPAPPKPISPPVINAKPGVEAPAVPRIPS